MPLCRGHHREVHRCGDEAAWWSKAGIDPIVAARTLWPETHPRFGQLARRPEPHQPTAPPAATHRIVRPPNGPEIAKRSQLSRLALNDYLQADRGQPSQRRKSTGPVTEEGKQRSRCNAVRHGLTAETVIGALEDAEDYQAFEAAIVADYDAQSAVERELVLRLASLLWRLRRATTMETGLFEMQADQLREFRQAPPNSTRTHEN